MVIAGALARKSGRRAGTAPEWPLCRRLARLRGAAPRPLGRAMAPLPGRPPPRCYLGENPRAIVRWRQTATRAILQPYQLFPECIIATLGRDFREGQGALHVVLSLFLHLVTGVVAAAPYCQTTLVIRMSTGSSPSALAPARGSRFVY